MRIGFYAWNLFQIQHVAALLRRLDRASLFFHARNGTDVDAILQHPTVADIAGRAEILHDHDIASLDQQLDALVFQTLFPGIERLTQPRLIALQYSMAKERHQYGAWRAIADLNLVYGPWSAERIAPFGPVAQVGNPRWSDHFDTPLPALSDFIPDFDATRRTLLYLPTWEELSSIDEFAPAVAALKSEYNVLFAPHHNSRHFESERTAVALEAITGSAATSLPLDVGHLIRASDVILSDFSGAIFDALLFEKPVLLLQSDALSKAGRKFGPESIEFQRRDEIGPVVERPEDLSRGVEDLLGGRLNYTAAHRRLRNDCFAAGRESADLAVAALETGLYGRSRRPMYQIYIGELCRESQQRQAELRVMKRRKRGRDLSKQSRTLFRRKPMGATACRSSPADKLRGADRFLFKLSAHCLPRVLLPELARHHERRGKRELARALTAVALKKTPRRALAWAIQLFVQEADVLWRKYLLDIVLAKPPEVLAPLLLRVSRLQNISGLRRRELAERRMEVRDRLRQRAPEGVQALRIAFDNRWLVDVERLAASPQAPKGEIAEYRIALETVQARLGAFGSLTEIANRNETANLLDGSFQCLHGGSVKRLSELPSNIQLVELHLPPYFYARTVTERDAHERICRFLRLLYSEVFASGAAVLPRHQYMLTHADPSGLADITLSYHTAGSAPGRWHIKDGALPGYFTIDAEGYAGWSSIASLESLPREVEKADFATLQENLKILHQETIEVNRSKYRQPERGAAAPLPDSFIFVPLQVPDDAVQQLAHIPLDGLINAMVAYARRTGERVIFKRHPSCTSRSIERLIRRAVRTSGVGLVEASIHDILPKAKAVVTVNSGVGLEALIHQKPVIVTGRADYGYACAQVSSVQELHHCLQNLSFNSIWQERILRFLYFYRRHYLVNECDQLTVRSRVATLLGLPANVSSAGQLRVAAVQRRSS